MQAFSEQYVPSILIFLFIGLFTPTVIGQTTDLAHVQASHAALEAAESDFEWLRSRGQLSTSAAADYHAYIARLRQQFLSACAVLAQAPGNSAIEETPCPGQIPIRVILPAIDQANEQTQVERTSALARQLDAALGDFDEMLLREQEQVKAAMPVSTASTRASGTAGATNSAGSSATNGTYGRSGDIPHRGDAAGDDPGGPGSGSAGMPSSSTDRSGGSRQTAAGAPPPDIPDGSDDDVVARQLREAAEKETDPELRARLWEEYRKYKRGTR